MNFPFGDQVVIVTRAKTGVDAYGDDVFEDVFETVQGAFDPAIGSESTNGQDQVSSQPQVYLPYGTDVTFASAIQVQGVQYEVDGDPNSWRSPFTGTQFGVVVPLKRVSG